MCAIDLECLLETHDGVFGRSYSPNLMKISVQGSSRVCEFPKYFSAYKFLIFMVLVSIDSYGSKLQFFIRIYREKSRKLKENRGNNTTYRLIHVMHFRI